MVLLTAQILTNNCQILRQLRCAVQVPVRPSEDAGVPRPPGPPRAGRQLGLL